MTGTGAAYARWTRGLPAGRLLGVPISVTPSWFVSVAVIAVMAGPVVESLVPTLSDPGAYAVAVLLAALLGVSVLLHELGHCVMAQRFGVGVTRVQLFLLGGVSEIDRIPRTAREEALVAGAGPVVSALLTGVFAAVTATLQPSSVLWLIAIEMAVANGIITVFNLLPALPLDGGRVLRAGIWQRSGNRRTGTVTAAVGGYVIGVLLAGWGVYRLVDGSRSAIVQGAIALAMALYIAVGARDEQTDREPPGWPADFDPLSVARPVVRLPAETPVEFALTAAADREVLLLGADGVVEAVLDPPAARSLAARTPAAPAARAGQRVGPDTVVLFSDDSAEIQDQLRRVPALYFLLIGQDGQPQGVLRREDLPGATPR
ncbi:site-2 protease family protein [Nakamurella deserti]|uniref:site-2 protease family protein n=1 Tax=Nakamurella deserti TaxID=2164074 RepID=UPI000DBE4C2D|nr:site-2 protease family protein [Nakamurella deserti]